VALIQPQGMSLTVFAQCMNATLYVFSNDSTPLRCVIPCILPLHMQLLVAIFFFVFPELFVCAVVDGTVSRVSCIVLDVLCVVDDC
jgi:hypothetical protein